MPDQPKPYIKSSWIKTVGGVLIGLTGLAGGTYLGSSGAPDVPIPGNSKFKGGVYYSVGENEWIFIPTGQYYRIKLDTDGRYSIIEENDAKE